MGGGSNQGVHGHTPSREKLAPTSNIQRVLRTVARANGWQVLDSRHPNEELYLLSGTPGRSIEVCWAAYGGVLYANGFDGDEWGHILRFDGISERDPSYKNVRVLSALAGRTGKFPPHNTTYPTAADRVRISTGVLRLPAEQASTLPMHWYARPEGECRELRATPRLAAWDKADHPDQVRLRAYLDDTEALLADSRIDGPWALRLDVGLPPGRDLLDMADLDNYAYPLAARLNDPGLTSVWCTKQHGPQSSVRIEPARQIPSPATDVLVVGTTASASTVAFKEQVHSAVDGAPELPIGPVRLELAFAVGPRRNWLNLWKQTIDSLDPLLGRTDPNRTWHPLDGRIIELGLHRTVDPALGHDVLIGVAATPA